MTEIICSKCHYGSFTRLTSNGGCICDNCQYVFRLEEAFKPISSRKFQQLSYEEVRVLKEWTAPPFHNEVQLTLHKELKEELELRG